jgi:hypothetical protein
MPLDAFTVGAPGFAGGVPPEEEPGLLSDRLEQETSKPINPTININKYFFIVNAPPNSNV